MTTFTYLSFASKQGLLVENGGAWTCSAPGGSCSQSFANGAYGPIMMTSTTESIGLGLQDRAMYLYAAITLGSDEFKGATVVPSTISFNIQATTQGGSPDPINVQSNVGGINYPYPYLQYNASHPVSLTHSGTWSSRPSQIILEVDAPYRNPDTSSVTVAISDLTFVIHDVVYGTTSIAGSPSPPTSSASSSSSISNPSSTLTSPTNSSMSLSRSTLFTTTILGHQTIMGSTILRSSNYGSQSSPLSQPNSPIGTSMTTGERAGVISSSLLGLVFIVIAFAFWCWWRRRRRMTGKLPRGDGQNESDAEARMSNREPWIPRPYRKRPYSRPTIELARVPPVEDQRVGPGEVERQEAILPSVPRSENASSYRLNIPPPAYSQITPGLASRSSMAVGNA